MTAVNPPERTSLHRGPRIETFTSWCREEEEDPDCQGMKGYDEVEVKWTFSSIRREEPNIEIRHVTVLWDAFEDDPKRETRVRNEVKLSMNRHEVQMLIASLQDVIAQSNENEEEWYKIRCKLSKEGWR